MYVKKNSKKDQNTLLIRSATTLLQQAGRAANRVVENHIFDEYQKNCKPETYRRQKNDLCQFARFLAVSKIIKDDQAAIDAYGELLITDPSAWNGVTHGLITLFIKWMLQEGYSIGTINVRLATVKRYAELAFMAGVISDQDKQLIQTVRGLKGVRAENENLARPVMRVGSKKAVATSITTDKVRLLKHQHDNTPVGLRDALMMTILLDHGLRCSEVVLLMKSSFDLVQKTFKFYRPKVRKWQTQKLTDNSLAALTAYWELAPATGCILRRTHRTERNTLADTSMNSREINRRVGVVGARFDVAPLSPHDCRHYWVTDLLRNGTPLEDVREMGGWATINMLIRYIEENGITNYRAKLSTATVEK